MADYNNPLEVAIKLIADPTQVTKVIEDLKKQGIALPASLDEKDLNKSVNKVKEAFEKKNKIQLTVEDAILKSQMTAIVETTTKRLAELKTSLKGVFDADTTSGLESKANILREIVDITKFLPKSLGKEVGMPFKSTDGTELKNIKDYSEALDKTIAQVQELNRVKAEETQAKAIEQNKAGLESIYNTSKQVLPTLVSQFNELAASGTASADSLKTKFTEVYAVFQSFKKSGAELNKLTGSDLPTELSKKTDGASVRNSSFSLASGSNLASTLGKALQDQEAVKAFIEEVKTNTNSTKAIGQNAIKNIIGDPQSQIAGLENLTKSHKKLQETVVETTAQEQVLINTINGQTLDQAIESFNRLGGGMKDDKVQASQLQEIMNSMFVKGGKVISLEEVQETKSKLTELTQAFEFLKETKQLYANTSIKNAQDADSYSKQLTAIEKLITGIENYIQFKNRIQEINTEIASIQPVNGKMSEAQDSRMTQLRTELESVTKGAKEAEQALTKVYKNNYQYSDSKKTMSYTKSGNLDTNGLAYYKDLNNVVYTLGKTLGILDEKGLETNNTLSNLIATTSEQANAKISANAEIVAKTQAEANALNDIAAKEQEILNLKEQVSAYAYDLGVSESYANSYYEQAENLEKELLKTKEEIAALSEKEKANTEAYNNAKAKALEIEEKLKVAQEERTQALSNAEALKAKQSGYEEELKKINQVNEELREKNKLANEKIAETKGLNSSLSVEQFEAFKNSVLELNKAIQDKSKNLNETSAKDIKCFQDIKTAVDNVATSVTNMYNGVGGSNLKEKLSTAQADLSTALSTDVADQFIQRLNNIEIKINKFDAEPAILTLRAQIEKELSNIQFNPNATGTTSGLNNVLTPTTQYLNDEIIKAYQKTEELRNNFELTDEQVKNINTSVETLINTMNKQKATGLLTPESLQALAQQKTEIADTVKAYSEYNALVKETANIVQNKDQIKKQASPENMSEITNSLNRLKAMSGKSSMNLQEIQACNQEMISLKEKVELTQTAFRNLRIPEDVDNTIAKLKGNLKINIGETGLNNIIAGYETLNTELKRMASDKANITYQDKMNTIEQLNNLSSQVDSLQSAHEVLKQVETLKRQSQNRSAKFINPQDLQDLEKLRTGLSTVIKDTEKNVGKGFGANEMTAFKDKVNGFIASYNTLKATLGQGIGADKSATQTAKLNYQIDKMITDMNLFKMQNSTFTKDTGLNNYFNQLISQMKQVQAQGNATGSVIMQLKSQATNFKTAVQMAGKMGRSFGDELSYIASKIGVKALLGGFTYRIISYFKQMITNVKELDTAMTNLKRVTDETEYSYNKFQRTMADTSHEIGTGYADLVNSVADFSKLGYNLNQASKLGEAASVYNKVGFIGNIEEATTSMVSMIKAFDISSTKAMDLVNKLNIVGE